MDIKIRGKYGTIADLDWLDVPPFAVVTGLNGVGKSQLLEVIAAAFGSLQPRGGPAGDNTLHFLTAHQKPAVSISGLPLSAREIFHSYSTWHPVGSGAATFENVRQVIGQARAATSAGVPTAAQFTKLQEQISYKAGVPISELPKLSESRFLESLTPASLWISEPQNLAFLFMAYRILEFYAEQAGKTSDEIRLHYGIAPWITLDAVMEAASLPFRCAVPDKMSAASPIFQPTYDFQVKDLQSGNAIRLEQLSSGERVLMSTALWQFTDIPYKLLLLDEPDAHLHPSMTSRLLDVIQKIYVERRGMKVIMTTHSPSTVALVPEESIFEMRRGGAPRIRRVPKAEMIAQLTSGFVAVHKGMAIVLCEGDNDPLFYTVVWQRLIASRVGRAPHLNGNPPLIFIHGAGRDTVRAVIPKLRAKGLNHFHGLIDRDVSNKGEDGIRVLWRYAVENYLYDPINVWCFLHSQGVAPTVDGIDIDRGKHGDVANLDERDLQRLADRLLSTVQPLLPDFNAEEATLFDVEFVGGKTLRYPRWLRDRSKDDLCRAFDAALPKLHPASRPYAALTTTYGTLDMIPKDLFDLMVAIHAETIGAAAS